jgi:ADP-ribose pyrophosphatase YjhB (NUDIX family)
MKFCSQCGATVTLKIPADDNRLRHVCNECHTIHYQNPRIVAGTLPVYGNKILLCKRAIELRYGYWTLPAGFMENEESTPDAAIRETLEEANARVKLGELISMIDVPHISQVHIFFFAELTDLNFSSGPESLEVELFDENDIPWKELAFPTVKKTLEYYLSLKEEKHDLSNPPLLVDTIRLKLPSNNSS